MTRTGHELAGHLSSHGFIGGFAAVRRDFVPAVDESLSGEVKGDWASTG
jgi:hypothetical protein